MKVTGGEGVSHYRCAILGIIGRPANRKWRLMSLGERGLLDTMRKQCWVYLEFTSTKNITQQIDLFGNSQPSK